jgi:hypothetical protein
MSWSLNASGHVPAQDPPSTADSAATEMELYEALKAVLSDPKYGASSSSFGGSHVSGSLHAPDA